MKRMLVCFTLLLMTLAAQAQMSDKQGGVAKAVAGLEQQWADGAKASNADMVSPLLADNFVNLNSDGSSSDRAQTLSRLSKSKWEMNQIGDVKVTVFGNTAIATGTWQGKGTDSEGKAVDAHERWVDTWMKMASGKWQCIASASAPMKM
jgi:ketosteroid isomerase-like protein